MTMQKTPGSAACLDLWGDGSYLALLDPGRFSGFVDEDWTLEGLHAHWLAQMQRQCLLVWATGFEWDWRIEWRAGITGETGWRETSGTLRASGDALCLAQYDSLSMAAQFADHTLPDADCRLLPLAPGLYTVRVVQRANPRTYFATPACQAPDRPAEFLIEYAPATAEMAAGRHIPWEQPSPP